MIKALKKLYRYTYKRAFSKYDVVIEDEVAGLKNLLDVGCGFHSPIHPFSKKLYCVGVDAYEPSIEESKRRNIHNEYFKLGVLEIDKQFSAKSFEAVVACDLIEHLEKEDGIALMDKMEKIASKKVIIFTPNGFLEQGDRYSNPWQVHLSGWTKDEFEKRGYRVMGMNGVKPLRTKHAKTTYKPSFFWSIISDLTEPFVKNKPAKAFQLLAIKDIK